MSCFFWKGFDIHGNSLEGAEESSSEEKILQKLRSSSIFSVTLERIPEHKLNVPLKEDTLIHFLTQIHRLLDSGLELVDCLNFLIQYQSSPFFSYLLCSMKQDLQDGKSLTAAFQRHQKCFPLIVNYLIEVADKSDRLPEVIEEMLIFFKFQQKFSQQRRKLLTYPIIVSGVAFILVLGILIFVIPMFKTMFTSFKDDLPMTTQWLISISDSLHSIPHIWLLVGIVLGLIIFLIHRHLGWGWLLRKIPPIHYIESSIRLLFYSQSVAIMLRSGVKLREALSLTEPLFPGNLQEEVKRVHRQIDAGALLVNAYSTTNVFPPIFVHLIAVGESSGHLASAFDRVVNIYEENLEKRMTLLNSMIEPIFILALACGILVILLSIYLPIFSMAEHF